MNERVEMIDIYTLSSEERMLQTKHVEWANALETTAFDSLLIYSSQFDNFIWLYSQKILRVYGFDDLPLRLKMDCNAMAWSFRQGSKPAFDTYCCESTDAQYIDLHC